MYSVSSGFLEAVQGDREIDYIISIGSINLKTDAVLQSLTIDRINQGGTNLVGNAVPMVADIRVSGIGSSTQLVGEEVLVSLGLKVDGAYEYVPFAPMYVESATYAESTKTWAIKCYDALYFANSKSINEIPFSYPITYHDYIESVCTELGLTLGTQVFTNSTEMINSAPNFNGYETLRTAISAFAEAVLCNAYIDREKDAGGNCVLKLKSIVNTEEAFDIGYKYSQCKRGSLYGPVNTLVLSREPQGDNVYVNDIDEGEGVTELKITNNPFLDYGQNDTRYTLIDSLFEVINGFSAQAYTLTYRCNWALDCYDNILLTDTQGATFLAMYAGDKLTYNGGIGAVSVFNAISQTQSDYTKATSLKSIIKDTYFRVDKAEGVIEQLLTATRRIDDALISLSNTVTSNAEQTDIVISKTGGSNLLRNSAFYKPINTNDDTDPWQLSAGIDYEILRGTSTEQETDSGSELILKSGSFSQAFSQISGETYTFACLIKNTNAVPNKTTYIRIYRSDNDFVEIPDSGLTYNRRTKLIYTYIASVSNSRLVIYTDNASTALSIADIRIVKGDASQEWSQYHNEVYGEGILIDNSGVEVRSLSGDSIETKLDSDSLVIRDGNNIVAELSDEKIKAPTGEIGGLLKIGNMVLNEATEGRILIYADTV